MIVHKDARTAPQSAAVDDEKHVWSGSSSQVLNFGVFAGCGLAVVALVAATVWLAVKTDAGSWSYLPLALALLPAAVMFKKWLDIRCIGYELTTQRLRISRGVLSKRIDLLELYRVKDISIRKPILLRLMGLGHVILSTSDHTTPEVVIPAVADPDGLLNLLRSQVETQRQRRGVKEVDFT